MMMIEETAIADAALPVAQFRSHLRLGTGFDESGLQDELLLGFLRAAVAAIEARTGKTLIVRVFTWTATDWRDRAGEVLPVTPVQSVDTVTVVAADGGESIVDPAAYRLERDAQRPLLRPAGGLLPAVSSGGSLRVSLTAGMSPDWGGLPADLGQAVLLLAAHYYEYRNETALSDGCMPFGVTSLIQRYRSVRLGLGTVQ